MKIIHFLKESEQKRFSEIFTSKSLKELKVSLKLPWILSFPRLVNASLELNVTSQQRHFFLIVSSKLNRENDWNVHNL